MVNNIEKRMNLARAWADSPAALFAQRGRFELNSISALLSNCIEILDVAALTNDITIPGAPSCLIRDITGVQLSEGLLIDKEMSQG